MKEWHACCRIDCRTCELYILTSNNDSDGKKLLAEKWGKNYKTQFLIEDMNCKGCKSDIIFKMCGSCDIKKCCMTHNVESCSDCSEFECDRIRAFYSYQDKNKTKVSFL